MPSKFLGYLSTRDVLNLCFISRVIRKIVLKVFNKIFCVSEGFCSSGQWFKLIKRNCFALIEEIYSSFFEDRFIFDFDENYSKLLSEFSHMSLFSICLHFLRCTRSCDKKSYYCCLCYRVRENLFFERNTFSKLRVCPYGSYLDMKSCHCLELDVFLIEAGTCVSGYTKLTKNCSFFQVFQCPQELFVCFSSILIRMYINCTLNALFFSPPKVKHKAFNVSLVDEKKILLIILRHAKIFLDKFWYTTNFKFFL